MVYYTIEGLMFMQYIDKGQTQRLLHKADIINDYRCIIHI